MSSPWKLHHTRDVLHGDDSSPPWCPSTGTQSWCRDFATDFDMTLCVMPVAGGSGDEVALESNSPSNQVKS